MSFFFVEDNTFSIRRTFMVGYEGLKEWNNEKNNMWRVGFSSLTFSKLRTANINV